MDFNPFDKKRSKKRKLKSKKRKSVSDVLSNITKKKKAKKELEMPADSTFNSVQSQSLFGENKLEIKDVESINESVIELERPTRSDHLNCLSDGTSTTSDDSHTTLGSQVPGIPFHNPHSFDIPSTEDRLAEIPSTKDRLAEIPCYEDYLLGASEEEKARIYRLQKLYNISPKQIKERFKTPSIKEYSQNHRHHIYLEYQSIIMSNTMKYNLDCSQSQKNICTPAGWERNENSRYTRIMDPTKQKDLFLDSDSDLSDFDDDLAGKCIFKDS